MVVVKRLKARVDELVASHHLDFVKVDPKYHSKLLGHGPDSINRYARLHRLSVWFPSAVDCGKTPNEFDFFIEGEQHSVEIVKDVINKLVKKWVSNYLVTISGNHSCIFRTRNGTYLMFSE